MIELHFPVTPAVGYGVVKIDASNYWMFLNPIVGCTSNYWMQEHPIVGFINLYNPTADSRCHWKVELYYQPI